MLTPKEEKRRHIITHAISVFSEKGFHDTKMQDIADSAEVGKGTLYEYFSTKEELFLAVYESWIETYEAEMAAAAQSSRIALEKANALIETTVSFYERHASHAPIMLEFWAHALRSQNPHFLNRIRLMKSRLSSLGHAVTKDLVNLGAFNDIDIESFTRLELAMSDGVFLQWVLDGQSYSLRDAYKFRQALIGSGLMSSTLRAVMQSKTAARLEKGFLSIPTPQKKKRKRLTQILSRPFSSMSKS